MKHSPTLATVFLTFSALLMSGLNPLWAQQEQPAVLQGSVTKSYGSQALQPVSFSSGRSGGLIERFADHQPLVGVRVSIPQMGFETHSGGDGHFILPMLPSRPVIASFVKEGYAPVTLTLDRDRVARAPILVSLNTLQDTLVVDAEIRHLGDGSYSPVSAGAGAFRVESGGPALRRVFTLPQPEGPVRLVLEIGSVIGLDTEAAHALGQSSFHRMSSPMQVLLNGEPIGEITANGDRQRLTLPASLLRYGQPNELEIRTGYRMTMFGPDYDDMELMLLTVIRQRA